MTTRLHAGGRRVSRTALELAIRHGAECWRCGDPIDLRLPHTAPDGLSIGHLIPAALGGTDAMSNLRPEHLKCNRDAGARPAAAELWPPCTACGCIHGQHHTYGARKCCPDCRHSEQDDPFLGDRLTGGKSSFPQSGALVRLIAPERK